MGLIGCGGGRRGKWVAGQGPKSRLSRATAVSGPTMIRAASGWLGLMTTFVSRLAVTTEGTKRSADLRSWIQVRPKAWAIDVSCRLSQPGSKVGSNVSRETSSGTTASTNRAALGGVLRLAWTSISTRQSAKLVPV
jgi:hypothetical protein